MTDHPPPLPSLDTPLPLDDPRMVAWAAYEQTGNFVFAMRWAAHPVHTKGALWAVFIDGYAHAQMRPGHTEVEVTEAMVEAAGREFADVFGFLRTQDGMNDWGRASMRRIIDAALAARTP